MTRKGMAPTQDRIVLQSSLSEMSKIFGWVEALASQYEIGENAQFAINLCLEEAVSNVIRHGYACQGGGTITVRFAVSDEGNFLFTVDDDAPPFNPLEVPALSTLDEQGEVRVGGQGIRLIRGFAQTLEYEPMPAGNRLLIGFSKDVSPAPTK
jgi:serine/threonine-protein kinase RsbW